MPTGTPPPLHPGVMRAAFSGELGNSTWVNVMHFVMDEAGPFGMSDVNTVVDDLIVKYADKFHDEYISAASHFSLCKVVYRDLADASTYRTSRVADYNGGSSFGSEPAQVSYLINWNSGDGRRGGKPRTYLAGVVEGDVNGETDVNPTVAATLSANANGFLSAISGLGTSQLVINHLTDYSIVDGGAYRAAAHLYEIFNGTCSPYIATQRRRVNRRRG